MSSEDLLGRLDSLERSILELQDEAHAIRRELREQTRATAPPPAKDLSPFPSRPAAPKRTRDLAPFPSRAAGPPPQAPPREPFPAAAAAPPRPPRRELDLSALVGAQALAWAGGVVTLLGVIFFFVLAVNRGWIGPGPRVACGAVASALVFGAGIWLRRRFGETYSSLAAVGAGIAGGYATLAAATVLYDLVPKPAGILAAAGIAAAGLAVSLAWRAETVAALGLVGAVCAPALLAVDEGISAAGTGFAAVITAAAAIVGVRMRWPWLLAATAAASAPQVAALTVDAGRLDGGAIAVAFVFALLYLATGVAEQFAGGGEALEPLPTAFVLGSIGVTWLAAAELFGPADGRSAGVSLLLAAAVFGAAAVGVWRRRQRELGTLVGTIALAAAAVGVANLLSGPTLAYTFAAEAAVLSVVARRVREPRLQLAALAYLVLAGEHALLIDAPPDSLFEAARHPATGAPALVAVAVAAFVVATTKTTQWKESRERGVLSPLAPVVAALQANQLELRIVAASVASLLAADAASLGVLELFESAWSGGGVVPAFHRGQVAVTGLWSLAGLGAVVLTSRRTLPNARALAFGWLWLVALKVVAYDATQLDGLAFSLCFGAIAGALLLSAFARELSEESALPAPESVVAVVASVAFAVGATLPLSDERAHGFGLLVVALVYGGFAASVFGRAHLRNFVTLLWVPAGVLAAIAAALLLDDTWLVLAWSAGAATLAWLGIATGERRFQGASAGYLVLAVIAAFVQAPPIHLVVAHEHPADGVIAVLLVIAATVAFARAARDPLERAMPLWSAGVLVVYAASLGILELFVRVSGASMHTDFQRGHSAVSALWGALGLTLLYFGLTRRRQALRIGGFALFAVSLGKLFLYDLSQLSSITRALSFLAVGAVLLLAGFFTQRLTTQLGKPDGPAAYS